VASLSNSNYTAPDATGTLVIGKATASIALTGLNQTYDGTAKSVTATTNPAGLTSISITYNGSSALPTQTGSYAVVASLSNSNYTAPDATGTLVIGKATASIALSNLNQTYDGTAKSVTATTSPAGLTSISITYNGLSALPTQAGSYAVVASLSNSNYTAPDATGTLVIGKATASIALSNLNQTYDGTAKSVTATTSPAGLTSISITYNGSSALPTQAGSYDVVASLSNSNYTAPDATGTLTILPKTITVRAEAKTKNYGDTDPLLTFTISTALASGDYFTGSLSRVPGENPGTYAIVQGSLSLGNNYILNYQPANLSITGGMLNFAALTGKTYGDADFRPPVSSSNSNIAIDLSSDNSAIATIVNGQVHILAAGTVNITASQAGAGSISRQLNIAKAGITVTANNQSRLYGAADPVFTVVYSGFVNGDDVSKLNTAATAVTTASLSSPAGHYPIVPAGASSANYNFNYISGILTIVALNNTDVISLSINPGTLSPAFNAQNHNYTASVDNSIDRVLISINLSDVNAVALINGSPSRGVSLNPGNNTIVVEVTAQDGKTKNSYILNVYRGMSVGSITATNILTPNNDGKNDRWVIQDIELYPNNNVKVFDRAGRIVYTKHGYNNEWDGALNGTGEPLTEGTYYYIVDLGTGKSPFKGFITIIRNR
jgi:gliding motility-associated-like protein